MFCKILKFPCQIKQIIRPVLSSLKKALYQVLQDDKNDEIVQNNIF